MNKLYTSWHINLGFSAIEIDQHDAVLRQAYWPLLELVDSLDLKFGLEISGSSLTRISQLDESWIQTLKRLVDDNRVEILASGWSQIIAPLVPWKVNDRNLKLGQAAYSDILGVQPRIAYVNEQSWSDSLVGLYRANNFDTVVVEWENSFAANPHWSKEIGFQSPRLEREGQSIRILWNHSTSFQKLQRMAHEEISFADWSDWIRSELQTQTDGYLCLYGGDVETIGYRPKRYATEREGDIKEWERIRDALSWITASEFDLVLPSEIEKSCKSPPVITNISTVRVPIPTKKQTKYNPLRWAVGGRNSVLINTKCQQAYQHMVDLAIECDSTWRDLLQLWASDYRTHITDWRWNRWFQLQEALFKKIGLSTQSFSWQPGANVLAQELNIDENAPDIVEDEFRLFVRTKSVSLILNKRKGLGIESVTFPLVSETPALRSFNHGEAHDTSLNADFFVGEFTVDLPGQPKISDLESVSPSISRFSDFVEVACNISTRLGSLRKKIRIFREVQEVQISYSLEWSSIPPCSMRFGDIVLNPAFFSDKELSIQTHNGGREVDSFQFRNAENVDHGSAFSSLISARQCFGVTEGIISIKNRDATLLIRNNQLLSKVPALLTYQKMLDSYFFRLQFTSRELDDTSFRHAISQDKRKLKFEISFHMERNHD
jgi:hypothetical protein